MNLTSAFVIYTAALLLRAAFGQNAFLDKPAVGSIVPYVDSGLREMANITLKFSINPSAFNGSDIRYTASCAAEGVVPSCAPGSLTPQSSGTVGPSPNGSYPVESVMISAVPYANATGQYTCAINVESSDSAENCELVDIPPPMVYPRINVADVATAAFEDSLNLLILSIAEMQSKPANDPTSWFAIAGIHGMCD